MQAEISISQLGAIEAANKILTASGAKGPTMKNIADEIRFSESSIYRYFRNEEEIIIAILDNPAGNMGRQLAKISQTSGSSEKKFKAIFHDRFSYFNKHWHFVVAVFSDGLMKESQNINKTFLKILGVNMKYLLPILCEGQQTGAFTNRISTEELLHIVMGSFRFRMFKWKMADFQFDIERYRGYMVQSILTIIENK